ncbi:SusD/RagB family nutrient-binding outer membrane lipoprotein [Sphingobacterium spiritivorum]|uniref:SusD/RagB family nutrient-binding outer membrane lipoprotein n=1 Tax=Sphingobacterium spiritivorum TaxID=258 RepID=UPI003DA5BEFF
MKRILKAAILFANMAMILSCSKNFEEINIDKNNPTPDKITAAILLPDVLIKLADQHVMNNYSLGNVVSQYYVRLQYNNIDIYNWVADDGVWKFYDLIPNINDIEQIAKQNNQPEYIGVALVLKALVYSMITDAYGDVPYTEAGKINAGVQMPKYDRQEDIYADLLLQLEEANTILAGAKGNIAGDPLYKGDIKQWQKFANALHLRLLSKVANRRSIVQEFTKIINNPAKYPIFGSNADNAVYQYKGSGIEVSPLTTGRGRSYEIDITGCAKPVQELLTKWKDPRLSYLYDAPKKNPSGSIVGVTPGSSMSTLPPNDQISQLSYKFFRNTQLIQGIFMTYSEQEFLLSEAVERKWISGDAKTHYDRGVKMNFEFWGLTIPAGYLSGPAAYEAGNLDLIAQQKWISYFWNGMEAWNDYKRTRRPNLVPGPANVNANRIPLRMIYPAAEQSVNQRNYQDAVKTMGGKDDINAKSWWNL